MTYFELLQFMKRYQTFIYTGDREADLDLIEEELNELHRLGMVDHDFLRDGKLALLKERRQTKK